MKRILLLLSLAIGCMTADAAAPKRKMLEQGKTWTYIYHHFEEAPTGSESDVVPGREGWPVEYTLKGDTVIDGRQYMKMYRFNIADYTTQYYAAYREDEEGRVYRIIYNSQGEEYKVVDFNDVLSLKMVKENLYETIKVDNQLFRRYSYLYPLADGTMGKQVVGVEGIGNREGGIIHNDFEPKVPCICDYEELYSVSTRDFTFYASDFNAPKEIELADGEQELINSNNDFAFNLFREARRDTSCVLSPLSITYALGMLNNGAGGQTLQEINQTLGFGEAGADAINAFCQKMLREANTLDPKTKALLANTIFVNEGLGYRLQEGFIDKANAYYDAQPQNRDFNDGETMDVINQWASDHTMGMIPKVVNKETFDSTAVSYLLNALYFKGTWSSPFRKEMTQDEPFGGGPEVPMMHKTSDFPYAENDLYQAIRLPYGNGAYRMTIFLPREDKTVGEVLETLNGSNWQPKYQTREIDLKLPRFETNTNQGLKKIMSDLGMPSAFDWRVAEFPYFCNTDVFISLMYQVAKIKLDEEGTEAAAVTVIGVEATGMPPVPTPFYANRPFLYIISEQSTGTIFFIGQYSGGVDADTRTGIIATKAEPQEGCDQIFNLAGQRLSQPPAHGPYIKNGQVKIK
ncbi:MAG: serpin family protein [Prevotella sp.]|nr:serpin family protein [Prevotella sp.]